MAARGKKSGAKTAPATASSSSSSSSSSSPGGALAKSPDSQCVINLVPPRALWGEMQRLRTLYVAEQRCAVHISFIDPFVLATHYAVAAPLLQAALADFPPFELTLREFAYFTHSKNSYTLYLAPECTPADALTRLHARVLEVFPQCADTRDKHGAFTPHFSLAKFKSQAEVDGALARLTAAWTPVSFTLREVYFLHRNGGTPFEVKHAVPLGRALAAPATATATATASSEETKSESKASELPFFGPGSADDMADTQVGRTVVVYGLPATALAGLAAAPVTSASELAASPLAAAFRTASGLEAVGAEVMQNPDGKLRAIAVVEFATVRDTTAACAAEIKEWPDAQIVRLSRTVFGDVVGGTCTLTAARSGAPEAAGAGAGAGAGGAGAGAGAPGKKAAAKKR